MRPPVTEHVPLHSKSPCKNIALASGGAKNMRSLSWGGAQTEKILNGMCSVTGGGKRTGGINGKYSIIFAFVYCQLVQNSTFSVFGHPSMLCIIHLQVQSRCYYIGNHHIKIWRIFSDCAPPVSYAPPVTEHVPLHSKSPCKNIARASGGCKKYAPTKLGGTNGKDP